MRSDRREPDAAGAHRPVHGRATAGAALAVGAQAMGLIERPCS
jgi:hypothetical protein